VQHLNASVCACLTSGVWVDGRSRSPDNASSLLIRRNPQDTSSNLLRLAAFAVTPRQHSFSDNQLETLQRLTFDYFLKETNPQNGLAPDSTRPGSPCS